MVLGPPKTFIAGNTVLGLALIMSLPLILISARMVRERWVELGLLTRWNRQVAWAMYGTFWLTCVAIMFTYSRGALLGLLAVGPFLFLKMRRKPVLVLLAVLAVGVVGVTVPDKLMDRWSTIQEYEEDGSAMGRIQSWGVSWNIAVENPILGAGFSSAGMPGDRWLSYANFLIPGKEGGRAAHSLYFQLLGHHGFGGFGVYMSLVICTVLTLNRIRRTAMATTGQVWLAEYAWAIQVSIFGFMVAGAFLDVAYFNLFFAYVALAVIMRRELAEARQAESSDTSVTDRGAGSRYVSSNGRRTFLPAGTPPSGSA